jgi:ribonuclease P protein component
MLHKDWRISRGKEYSGIYKKGRRIAGQYMIVFLKENQLARNRFGIVTSKKVGNAVIRNRAKRQIREVIRKNLNNLPNSYDMVVVARFNIKAVVFELIEKDFLRLMRKASTK